MTLELRASTDPSRRTPRPAAIIVVLSIVGIRVLSLWYLVQPLPLLVQGEGDATLIDRAAQVDGRGATRSVHRGEIVQSGQRSGPARRTGSTANPVQE
jgi:HlyD family secretion protein